MSKRNIFQVLTLILIGCLCGSPRSVRANPVESAHVTAQLIPEVETILPEEPFWVALHLKMDEGWHTYWKNPGDSGLATRLKWDLPEGWEAGPVFWPYPERFEESGLSTYGYHGDAFLLVKLKPPLSLASGDAHEIRVQARWLSCEKICIPGQAQLTLTLPVDVAQSLPDPRWQKEFAGARSRLPREDGSWQVRAVARPEQFLLRFSPPQGAGDLADAYFFPGQNDIVDHAGSQKLRKTGTGYELSVPRSSIKAQPERVKGVLVFKTAGQADSGKMAFEVDASLVQ